MNAYLSKLYSIYFLKSLRFIPTVIIPLIPQAHIFQDPLEYLLYKISVHKETLSQNNKNILLLFPPFSPSTLLSTTLFLSVLYSPSFLYLSYNCLI